MSCHVQVLHATFHGSSWSSKQHLFREQQYCCVVSVYTGAIAPPPPFPPRPGGPRTTAMHPL